MGSDFCFYQFTQVATWRTDWEVAREKPRGPGKGHSSGTGERL